MPAPADRSTRLSAYATASTGLALLSDHRLSRLLDDSATAGSGLGGTTAVLEVEGVKVFAKKVALTDRERRPEHVMSTANLFGLPGYYQYGVGSAGFGAWRELAVHTMTTGWVLADRYQGFPLLYHWRVLPDSPAAADPYGMFGGLDEAVAYWDGSPAVRDRLEAIRDSTASIVLFLEHLPQTLGTWLAEQEPAAHLRVDRELAAGAAFLRANGLLHFDAHFLNLLTDGHRIYFSDFGLALSSRFELSPAEREFFASHRHYDRAHMATHLLLHHLPLGSGAAPDRHRFLRGWTEGTRPGGVPAPSAKLLGSHAPTAVVLGGFHRSLRDGSKRTPYPAAELARAGLVTREGAAETDARPVRHPYG
ncbi:protein kinase family protein [Kitasatospora sp. NBC_00374]|uniref:protein kinase family protein n=1 Tax=Kitasatospora sp. NBC_00374 TaxID=2975964 RepID=UPI00324C4789